MVPARGARRQSLPFLFWRLFTEYWVHHCDKDPQTPIISLFHLMILLVLYIKDPVAKNCRSKQLQLICECYVSDVSGNAIGTRLRQSDWRRCLPMRRPAAATASRASRPWPGERWRLRRREGLSPTGLPPSSALPSRRPSPCCLAGALPTCRPALTANSAHYKITDDDDDDRTVWPEPCREAASGRRRTGCITTFTSKHSRWVQSNTLVYLALSVPVLC